MLKPPINFSPSELGKFRDVYRQFWPLIKQQASRRSESGQSDDTIVQRLVTQVAVIGNSNAGSRLGEDTEAKRSLRWDGHLDGKSHRARVLEIHSALRRAGVRWAGKTVARCRYSTRLAASLAVMERSGGPRAFIASIARLSDEDDRLARVQELPILRGSKGARDFLTTGLGLATWKVALDLRVLAVLREIAPGKILELNTPPRGRYLAIERALIRQVCPALACNGFELDQLLYLGQDRDGRVVKFLRTGAMPSSGSKRTKRSRDGDQCTVC